MVTVAGIGLVTALVGTLAVSSSSLIGLMDKMSSTLMVAGVVICAIFLMRMLSNVVSSAAKRRESKPYSEGLFSKLKDKIFNKGGEAVSGIAGKIKSGFSSIAPNILGKFKSKGLEGMSAIGDKISSSSTWNTLKKLNDFTPSDIMDKLSVFDEVIK